MGFLRNKKKQTQPTQTELTKAVFSGDLKVVSSVLEKGVDINAQNPDGTTALFWAARSGNYSLVSFLIEKGANATIRDTVGNTASIWAYNNNHVKVGQLLALYMNGSSGNTPLMNAIDSNCLEFVPGLLKNKENLDVKNIEGNTALMLAVYHGYFNLVLELLKNDAELLVQNKRGQTALDIALERGHAQIIQWLAHYQAVHIDTNTQGGGYTPLMKAAKWGYEDIIPFLIDKENHKEAKNQEGNTALLLAAQYGSQGAVSRLLKANVHFDTQNDDGNTALMLAAKKGYYNIAAMLLDQNANLNIKNRKGQSALYLAAASSHKELVALLLAKGAEVTPNLVLKYKNKEITQLISRYHQIGTEIREGESPLMRAIRKGYLDVVKLWIAKGADLNSRNEKKSQTPLMIAVQCGRLNISAELIKNGANLNFLDNEKMSALHYARQLWFRNKEINLLIASGAIIAPRTQIANVLKPLMLPLLESCLNKGNLGAALNIFKTCLETYSEPDFLGSAHGVLRKFFLEIPRLSLFRRFINKIIDFFNPKQALSRASAKIGDVRLKKDRLAYESLISYLIAYTPISHRAKVIEQLVEKSEPKGRYQLQKQLYSEYHLTPPSLAVSPRSRLEPSLFTHHSNANVSSSPSEEMNSKISPAFN